MNKPWFIDLGVTLDVGNLCQRSGKCRWESEDMRHLTIRIATKKARILVATVLHRVHLPPI